MSAVAKGFAIDHLSSFFDSLLINSYFIELGGEIKYKGNKQRKTPWLVAIENPEQTNLPMMTLSSRDYKNLSLATSGEYRNPGHIWGKGPKDAVSITVIGENTTEADAWATAMYVLGVEEGLEIAEKEGLAVFFIKNDGKSVNSSEWSKIYP